MGMPSSSIAVSASAERYLMPADVASDVERESVHYYAAHPVCALSKHEFSKAPFSLLGAIAGLFTRAPISPADRVMTLGFVRSISSTEEDLSPRLLSALEKAHPEMASDERWRTLLTRDFPTLASPTKISYKNAYILHYFMKKFREAGCDARNLKQHDLALLTENSASLTGIELGETPFLTDAILKSITSFIPHLKTLHLTGRSYVTSEGLEKIIKASPELEHMQLGAMIIKKSMIDTLKESCTTLKSLDLTLLDSAISSLDLVELFDKNPHIATLTFSESTSHWTDDSLDLCLSHLPSLKELALVRMRLISPSFFNKFFTKRGLDKLTLDGCNEFIDSTLTPFNEYYNLKRLVVRNCRLSPEGYRRLALKFPYLEAPIAAE